MVSWQDPIISFSLAPSFFLTNHLLFKIYTISTKNFPPHAYFAILDVLTRECPNALVAMHPSTQMENHYSVIDAQKIFTTHALVWRIM